MKRLLAGLAALLVLGMGSAPEKPWKKAVELKAKQRVIQVVLGFDRQDQETVWISRVKIRKHGHAPVVEGEGDYELTVTDAQGTPMYSTSFDLPHREAAPPEDENAPVQEVQQEPTGHFSIVLPFPDEADGLTLTYPDGTSIYQHWHVDKIEQDDRQPKNRFKSHRPGRSKDDVDASTGNGVFDIAIVGDKFTSEATFNTKVDAVLPFLLSFEPYKSRLTDIVLHRVQSAGLQLGCAHSASMSRLIVCNQTKVVDAVMDAGAPFDKIIVLTSDGSYGGSGGGLYAVSYTGDKMKPVVVHEFGHTLAGLWDGYVLYGSNGPIRNQVEKNCFSGVPPQIWCPYGCAKGCAYPNWYRQKILTASGTIGEDIMRKLGPKAYSEAAEFVLDTKITWIVAN